MTPTKNPVVLSNGLPAYTRRRTGYITQTLINRYGSKEAALAALNAGRAA